MSSNHSIDFAELRRRLSFSAVLKKYNVRLTRRTGRSDEYIAYCPLPKHGPASGGPCFTANFKKGVFRCVGCGETGNVLDFAVLMAGLDKREGKDVQKVAITLQAEILGEGPRAHDPRTRSVERRSIPPVEPGDGSGSSW